MQQQLFLQFANLQNNAQTFGQMFGHEFGKCAVFRLQHAWLSVTRLVKCLLFHLES